MSCQPVEPLPNGWEMRLDDATNTYYFIDHTTRSTQWNHPISRLVYRPNSTNGFAVPSSNDKMIPINIEREPEPLHQEIIAESKDRTAMNLIDLIAQKARSLSSEVEIFKGSTTDKEYRRLMECLEVLILELDGVDVNGQEDARELRRSTVCELQKIIHKLESSCSTPDSNGVA